ncbi:MAG TPA: hypothetical protein VJ464_09255 [Blastocatellia bacterium]|nr:hypothetical protein [Blastocatellia bacterium]
MKRLLSFTLFTFVFFLTVARAQAQSAVGAWDITIETPQGPRTSQLVIKQDGDKLTGVMKRPNGERPLDSITVKGSDITFLMTINVQGQDMVVTYKGKVEKEKMSGDADFGGFASGTWSAVPHKEGAAATPATPAPGPGVGSSIGTGNGDISGVWNVTVETPMGTGTPTLTLKQDGEKITGTYKGQLGESPVTGTVKGNDVTLMYKVSPQGEEITVTYTGKRTAADAMSGKAVYGSLGEGTWTAKKK